MNNVIRLQRTPPRLADPRHAADLAMLAAHDLSVSLVTENASGWLVAAHGAWATAAGLRGVSRREAHAVRIRLARAGGALRRASVAPERLEGERVLAAAAARRVETAMMLTRISCEGAV